MVKLKWTPKAKKHLRSIYDYISRDSAVYAKNFVARLVRASEKIAEFPEIGRVVPELPEYNLREIIFQKYRIDYRYLKDKQMVQILAVVHGGRDIEKISKEEWEY